MFHLPYTDLLCPVVVIIQQFYVNILQLQYLSDLDYQTWLPCLNLKAKLIPENNFTQSISLFYFKSKF